LAEKTLWVRDITNLIDQSRAEGSKILTKELSSCNNHYQIQDQNNNQNQNHNQTETQNQSQNENQTLNSNQTQQDSNIHQNHSQVPQTQSQIEELENSRGSPSPIPQNNSAIVERAQDPPNKLTKKSKNESFIQPLKSEPQVRPPQRSYSESKIGPYRDSGVIQQTNCFTHWSRITARLRPLKSNVVSATKGTRTPTTLKKTFSYEEKKTGIL
jgi:hypothetical protein